MFVMLTALTNGMQDVTFKNPLELMLNLLKKGDKYVDVEEAERVNKNLRVRGSQKLISENYMIVRENPLKNKLKNEHMSKENVKDRSTKQR